jgi:hypothetical protein
MEDQSGRATHRPYRQSNGWTQFVFTQKNAEIAEEGYKTPKLCGL